MPSQKRTKGGYYGERRREFMRAMSLAVFNSKLWLCDPLAGYHKAGEGCREAQDELQDMSWVKVQWMTNQANRTEMWIPRVNLSPPHLDPQFEVPSSFMQTPMTTPTPSSLPSPPRSDGGCDDVEGSNPDTGNRVMSGKMPSGGRNGSRVCMAAVVGVGVATAMCVVAGRGGTGGATANEVVTVRAVAVEAAATGTAETVAAV